MSPELPPASTSLSQRRLLPPGAHSGLRAHVWIEASALFRREEARHYCWLWLHGRDGEVQALRLDARALHRDELIEPLLAARCAQPPRDLVVDGRPLRIDLLEQAAVVPQSRWSHSWGHPVNEAIRNFAETLDAEVLRTLGRLERPGLFLGSTRNYSRLATLPQPTRAHRLQALMIFPPLITPLLLDALPEPELFVPAPEHRLDRRPQAQAVLEAMDRGRDLSGALSAYWRVDRALIRSPLLRQSWPAQERFAPLLRLLQALPVPARPTALEPFIRNGAALLQLLDAALTQQDLERLGKAFSPGWQAIWQEAAALCAGALGGLREVRDFLCAVIDQQPPPANLQLSVERLALAWIARRGVLALIRASQHWHTLPAVTEAPPGELPTVLMPVLGEFRDAGLSAIELCTRQALIAEGLDMDHCVGDYWDDCVFRGTRIWHLVLETGETATAEFALQAVAGGAQLHLVQLKGPENAEPSAAMQQGAERLAGRLRAETLRQRRAELMQAVQAAVARFSGRRFGRTLRPLDLRLRRELAVVLAYCQRQPDWLLAADTLYRGPLAGFRYAHGPGLLGRLQAGDALELHREPDNPHDAQAVRVDWQGCKLGYLPRRQNPLIAQRLDAGERLRAQLIAIEADARAWDPLTITVRGPEPG